MSEVYQCLLEARDLYEKGEPLFRSLWIASNYDDKIYRKCSLALLETGKLDIETLDEAIENEKYD